MRPDIYWTYGPWPGRLAILPRPRGADWLGDEAAAWRRAGLDVIVSTLIDEENAELALDEEARLVESTGLTWQSLPIPDRGIPDQTQPALALLHELDQLLAQAKNIGVHCRQGIGHSALIASSLLVLAGLTPEAAIDRVSQARAGPVPETLDQRRWIDSVAHHLQLTTDN
jgi:protein-tyrosine phosphatase